MATRQPTDKCLLCGVNDATKPASHIVPSYLLNSVIGKRHKEHSFLIDTSTATIDEYFGRDVSPTTEIKEHHHAPDFYLCPQCESKLGELESRLSEHITNKLREPKFSANYRTKSAGGLTFKEILKVSTDDFNVFFLSIVWRQAVQRKVEDGVSVFTEEELETLRLIINSYLSKDEAIYKDLCDQFGLMVLTADSFGDATMNFVSALNHRARPYIFLMNEFWVFVYPAQSFEESKKLPKPEKYFHIPPFIEHLNYPGKTPNIVFLPQNTWTETLKQWIGDVAPIYTFRLNQKIANANAAIKQSQLRRRKKGRATKKARRAARKARKAARKARRKTRRRNRK